MYSIFLGTALCTDNYNNLLNGWGPQTVKKGVSFDGGTSKYSSTGASARAALTSKGWTITDAGLGTTADTKCVTNAIDDETVIASEIILYPNPGKDKLTIRFAAPVNEQLTYRIFNITGLLVLENQIDNNGDNLEVGLEALPQGAYIFKVKSQENVIVRSFVKE